jgi:hypothetical protein
MSHENVEMVRAVMTAYRNHDGCVRIGGGGWRDLEFEIQDVRDAGDDVVVLIHNQRQWGRHSGIRTELPPYAQVFTLCDAKLVHWRTFPDQESALEAVGLRE